MLTAAFVHLGLLATPFFGSGAFLWATVFAAFLLALALGWGLGDVVASAAGRRQRERAAARLAVAGGLCAWLAAYLLPVACRWILERDPSWVLAPAAAIVLVSLVPGMLIAAIGPSELRVRLGDGEGGDARRLARGALRLLGLNAFGGVVGVMVSGRALLRPDEVDVWLQAYAAGALLAVLGLVLAGTPTRVIGALSLVGLITLSAARPSEIQELEFAVALEDAWREAQGPSVYYRRTAQDEDLLSQEELAAHYRKVEQEAGAEKSGVILTCELLQGLDEIKVTGDGLRHTLGLLLPPTSRPYLMPIFEQVASIRSNGKGMLFVEIRRERGVEGAKFFLPGAQPGERIQFWFKDDFTIHLAQQGHIWRLEFGPRTTEEAGLLELNDTVRTPIRLIDVKFYVDASLHGIVLEDYPDQVVIKAVAQGEVGGVTTQDVISIPKERASAAAASGTSK